MTVGQRGFVVGAVAVLLAVTAGVGAAGALAAAASQQRSFPDARVVGTFKMNARVTAAVNVRGEKVGQRFTRTWKIVPEHCVRSVCQLLRLNRERSDGRHDHLSLHRVASGEYSGKGVFYVALECLGKVYHHGSRVPFTITLKVHHVVTIQGISFAQSVGAMYYNPHRSDSTPCPLGPSHDAGRYHGHLVSPLPQPPVASFSATVDPKTDTAVFTDTSHRTADGRKIVSFRWNFGDPASGSSDHSSQRSPTHQFSAPGVYRVKLTVVDRNGLSSTATESVTAPGPPQAAFTDSPTGSTGTFSFTDSSRRGVGGAAIVSWQWNFGDPGSGSQNSSTVQDPSHTFSAPGTYMVRLTVTDANGLKSSITHSVKY
ncbi:MAG TPA: PKD domain-containing protein [Solirubrobacteraceae bacterium]|nr:PKD domain-containing protein [Solirubrobacteraceae bacterium]